MLIHNKQKFGIEVGRSLLTDRLGIRVWWGFIEDCPPNYVSWRHFWEWNLPRLPELLWCRGRLIGICAFGRCRIFR